MIHYLTAPFRWFFKLEAASGLILLIAAIIALILSNSNLSDFYFNILNTHLLIGVENFGLDLSILHWINDALMAIFFFVVTLEIKREFIHGELSKPKQALLPIIAPFLMMVFFHPSFDPVFLKDGGCKSLIVITPWPINTLFSINTFEHINE